MNHTTDTTDIASMTELDDWAREAVRAVEAELERVTNLPGFRIWATVQMDAGPWNERDCAEKWVQHYGLDLPALPETMRTITGTVRYERAGFNEWFFRLSTESLEHEVQGEVVSVAIEALITADLQPSGDLVVQYSPPAVAVTGGRIEDLTGEEAIAVANMLRIAGEALL